MKKKIRSFFIFILTTACLLLLISACGIMEDTGSSTVTEEASLSSEGDSDISSEEQSTDDPIELDIWVYMDMNTPGDHYVNTWKELAKKYGYELNIKTYTTQEMKNKLKIAVASKELPDIFMVKGGSYPYFLFDAQACAPLQDYFVGSNSLFKDSYLEPYKDGNNYIIPCYPDSYLVTYANNDLLRKMGLTMPESWDQLVQFVYKVEKYNKDHGTDYSAIELGDKDSWLGELLYCNIVNSLDYNALDNLMNGTQAFSDDVYKTAAEYVQTLVYSGAFPEDYIEMGELEAVDDFQKGNAVIFPYHSAVLYYLEEQMGDSTLGVYSFPSCNESLDTDYSKYNIVTNYSLQQGLCISSYSDHQSEAAQLCLEYAEKINEVNVMQYGCIDITRKNLVAPATFSDPVQQYRNIVFYSRKESADWYGILPQEKADSWNNLTKKLYAGEVTVDQFQKEGSNYLVFDQQSEK